MGKWLAGIAATVIASVLIYYITGSDKKSPPPPSPDRTIVITPPPSPPSPPRAKVLRGYLAVDHRSRINAPEDLGVSGKLCAMKNGASFLRSFPPLAKYTPVVISPSELYQAFTSGMCSAIFFSQREHADKLLPVNVTSMRLIPVYE